MKKKLLNIKLSAIVLMCAGLFFTACKEEDPQAADFRPGTPYITVDGKSIAFKGKASSQKIVVDCNREVIVVKSSGGDWISYDLVPIKTGDRITGYVLEFKATQSNVPKKRTASFILESLERPGETKKAPPVTIEIGQTPFGLPEADLLDVVFDTVGLVKNGYGNATDISPAKNTIHIGRSYTRDDGVTIPAKPPVVAMNDTYERFTATFSGPGSQYNNGLRWGTCYYRVDFVDYKDVKSAPKKDSKQIDLNAIGKALNDSITLEVLCKWNSPSGALYTDNDGVYRFSTPFSGMQRTGAAMTPNQYKAGMGIVHTGAVTFLTAQKDTCDSPTTHGVSDLTPTETGKYYHILGTYASGSKKIELYVDGVKIGESSIPCKVSDIKMADPENPEEALAQFFVLGGNPRACDPFNNGGVKINTPSNDAAEQLFDGEIVTARIYGKVLTQAEITVLYNYEKP